MTGCQLLQLLSVRPYTVKWHRSNLPAFPKFPVTMYQPVRTLDTSAIPEIHHTTCCQTTNY